MEALCDNAGFRGDESWDWFVGCVIEVIAKISDFYWMKLNGASNMGTCGFNSYKKIKLLKL